MSNQIKTSKAHTELCGGIPIYLPNDVSYASNDFHISFNHYDRIVYGDVTTALVLNEPTMYFILNGNHEKQYNSIMKNGGGFKECLQYFYDNIKYMNRLSDKIDEKIIWKNDGLVTVHTDEFLKLLLINKESEI